MVSRVIPVEAFDLVIFGGTGDLARRKILPGLFRRFCAGQMPAESCIVGAARSQMDGAKYREFVAEAIAEFGGKVASDAEKLSAFLQQLDYVPIDARGVGGWEELADKVKGRKFVRAAQAVFGAGGEVNLEGRWSVARHLN